MDHDTVTVERVIAAPADQIFAVLADAGRHSEIDGSGSLRGTKSPAEPLHLGSVFGMKMHQGANYSTSNEVVEFEQGRLIAWQTSGFGGFIGGRIWRYEMEPVEGGTRVRETWDLSQDKQRFLLKRTSMPRATEKAMTKTLERLSEVVARN